MDENKNKSKIKTINLAGIVKNIGIDKLLIIAICGVVLIMLPASGNKKKNVINNDSNKIIEKSIEITGDEYCEKLEMRLEELLISIKGVGNVKVMITLKSTYLQMQVHLQRVQSWAENKCELVIRKL